LLDTATFGRKRTTSSNVETFNFSRVSEVSAWIVIGTFWTLSERRCAVTTDVGDRIGRAAALGAACCA